MILRIAEPYNQKVCPMHVNYLIYSNGLEAFSANFMSSSDCLPLKAASQKLFSVWGDPQDSVQISLITAEEFLSSCILIRLKRNHVMRYGQHSRSNLKKIIYNYQYTNYIPPSRLP